MIEYVAGFLFSPDRRRVALIEKQRPRWQRGLLNGIGGKIENGESAFQAMEREFGEETGVIIPVSAWDMIAQLEAPDWRVYFFAAFSPKVDDVRTTTDERVVMSYMVDLPRLPVIRNLRVLLPLAADQSGIRKPLLLHDDSPPISG